MQGKPVQALGQIDARGFGNPNFCAGFVYDTRDGFIVDTAPILRRFIGKHINTVRAYCALQEPPWSIIGVEPQVRSEI